MDSQLSCNTEENLSYETPTKTNLKKGNIQETDNAEGRKLKKYSMVNIFRDIRKILYI